MGLETSCDDTSVALVNDQREVLACEVLNQDSVHHAFGGIVPEMASRSHTEKLLPALESIMSSTGKSWADVYGIAVTNRPGLMGSLIVGVTTAKALSLFLNKKYIGVHHIEGHIASGFLQDSSYRSPGFFKESFVALVVSGGHTQIYEVRGMAHFQLLSESIDDAAGEVIDKFAKTLGLGFPGGAALDRLGQSGDPNSYVFPTPKVRGRDMDMSFSGLKTAGLRKIESLQSGEGISDPSHLAASFQSTVCDILMDRLQKAVVKTGLRKVVVAGGVSANSVLRERLAHWRNSSGIEVLVPPLRFCTDNAAMIALAGLWRLSRGETSDLNLTVQSRAGLQ